MENFGWSWEEFRGLPYERYLEFKRIQGLEAKEQKKQQEKAERKANRKH